MKRAAVFAMVVVVIASAWTYLAAQSSPSGSQKTAPEPTAPAPPQSPKYERERLSAPAPQMHDRDRLTGPSVTPLQQRYVDLATKKARLMTEEQLQQAVNELDRDVDELNAWAKVEESARALREVIEKHPQTRAAGTARSAIRIIEQGRSINSPAESLSPRPDPVGQPLEAAPHFERPPADRPVPQKSSEPPTT